MGETCNKAAYKRIPGWPQGVTRTIRGSAIAAQCWHSTAFSVSGEPFDYTLAGTLGVRRLTQRWGIAAVDQGESVSVSLHASWGPTFLFASHRRRYGLNFSAPPIPRPETPPSPGPGQYEIVDYKGPPKHYISSAVFVSNTSRWASDKFHQEIPGPGQNCCFTIPIPIEMHLY